jgi:23S rRNA (cytosine1962-C5)-methyltransferase
VLNLFAYSDAFGIVALAAGASQVLAVDSSTSARSLAEAQYALNSGCEPERREYRVADAFEQARLLRQDRATFDLVVVDPPRLVARKDRLQRGLRAYKDINLQVLHLLRPGGLLITFSCSGIVERELFMKVVEGAARDAGRPVRLLESLGLPPDHPRRLGFPESEYLKGLVLGV